MQNIVSTMSDTEPYLFLANPTLCYTTATESATAYHRTESDENHHQRVDVSHADAPAAEILLAVSCQPGTTALY